MNRCRYLAPLTAWFFVTACFGDGGPHRFRNVSLGLSANQVRGAFEAPGAGVWTTETSPALALVWTPTDRPPRHELRGPVRFEFHDGRLVAIRAAVASSEPVAHGNRLDIRPISVIVRDQSEQGQVSLRLLARDCPTHAEEVSTALREPNVRTH